MNEYKRKGIHVLSVLFLIFYMLFPEYFAILVYAALIAATELELVRFYFGRLIVFDELLRESERERFAGYFYLILGLSLLVSLAPNAGVLEAGILIAALADAAGAIVGQSFGKRRFKTVKQRSIEGTLAGFFTALLIGLSLFEPGTALLVAILYTLNDLFRPGDDNLSNPLVPLVAWILVPS